MTESAAADATLGRAVAAQLERLAQIAAELGDESTVSEAHAERGRFLEARFFVTCLGQFKRGKSTLLNALVGQPVLPVGVVPVTSVITILHHGDRPTATVRFSDGHSEPVAVDAIAAFIDERQNPGNRRHAAVVDVALPSPTLRGGLCLVDTPGLGSVHATNTEATRAFVPRTDVALIVVGPDPPISGAELQLAVEVAGDARELLVVLNKADQSSAEHLREIIEFTRTTLETALQRPVGRILEISALERVAQGRPTRDWRELENVLSSLSSGARHHLVETAGRRAVRRFGRSLVAELRQCDEALRRPIADIEARKARLQRAVADLDRSLGDLRFLFDAVEMDLGKEFEQRRVQFVAGALPELQTELTDWLGKSTSARRSPRTQALEEAHGLVIRAIEAWLRRIEPEAGALYQKATDRLIQLANDYLSRVAHDAGDLDANDLPPELGFRARRQFYFTSLMHVTGSSPLTWLVDRFAPKTARQRHAAGAAADYMRHLLDANSHRVENDLKDRALESRRWLEGQIRNRLAAALRSAERAVTVAAEKQYQSETEVCDRLARLQALRDEAERLTR